jgi:hypothetical protein
MPGGVIGESNMWKAWMGLVVLVAGVPSFAMARPTYAYRAFLDSSNLPGSESIATGEFYGDFGGPLQACTSGDNRFFPSWYTDDLECELVRVQFEKRVDDQIRWSFHVPPDTEMMEFPIVYCRDLELDPEYVETLTPVWVVLETTCHPEGEISGQIWVDIGIPIETVSWGQIKSRFEGTGRGLRR